MTQTSVTVEFQKSEQLVNRPLGLSAGEVRLSIDNMNSQVTVETVEIVKDVRGWVMEPVDEMLLAGKRNVHVVCSEPGAVRGNHYHEQTLEVFVVVGPALVRIRERESMRDIPVADGHAVRFTIPPGVAHAIKNTGVRPMILISFTNQLHDRSHPDTVRAELL